MPAGKYIRTKKWRKNTSQRMKKAFKDPNSIWNTPKVKEKMYKGALGKKHSEEGRENHRLAVLGEKHPMYGKHHTKETKLKQQIASKAMWKNPNAVVNSKEHRKKLSLALSGTNHPMYGKRYSIKEKQQMSKTMKNIWNDKNSIFHSASYKRNRRKMFNGRQLTSIEKIMHKILKDLNIKFTSQNAIGKYYVDFLIPKINLIIETDGSYSHGDPRIYNPNDKILGNITAKEKWKKDKMRDLFLKEKGYTILRFWEYDINNNLLLIKSKLKKHI